jgi:glycosyltransferase involved in cell wall biosynthesis
MPLDSSGKPPRILFVIGQLNVGGTEGHLALIAPEFARRGWSVRVYSLFGNGPIGDVLVAGQVQALPNWREPKPAGGRIARFVRLLVSAFDLLREMYRYRPTIVHFFLPAAYLVGAPLAAVTRIANRVMSRRCLNSYQRPHPMVGLVERQLHRTMNAVLANSRSVLDELREDEGVPVDKLVLIYNGIDLKRFEVPEAKSAARGALGLPDDALVLVTVANLIPYKGHRELLEALANAHAQMPGNWRLLIVGRDDGIGDALRQAVLTLGLEAHVDFLGARSDVPRLLAAADIGLLCSHEEGFSNALLEGMASGLPMIATAVGGNVEAIRDGETGLLVPAKSPRPLSEAILRLAGDPVLRARLGKAARNRVTRDFSLDTCVDRYEQLYRALLAGKPVATAADARNS